MKYIIDKILAVLQENNISMYSFANQTKINKSTMHKLMHMERNLKPKYFYSIIDNLPASNSLKYELTSRYNRLSLGEKRYNANLYIQDMINNLSEMSFTVMKDKLFLPESIKPNHTEPVKVYKGNSVRYIISLLLIDEMHKPNPSACVYLPGNGTTLKSHIDNVVKLYDTSIRISFLLDVTKGGDDNSENYNLGVLKSILPMAMSFSNNYSFYYTYVDKLFNDSNLTPYPYFISLSDAVVFLNLKVDEALVINDTPIAKNLRAHCEGKRAGYKKLINTDSDIISIVNNIVDNQPEVTTHCCIEYEPCLAFFYTEEMIESTVPAHMPEPERSQLIHILNIRRGQLENIKKTVQLFNRDSLKEFARTGIIHEFPKAYSRPCTVDERHHLLNCLLQLALDPNNNHIIRAANPVHLEISDCLSLIIQDDSYIQFTIFNDNKLPLKYLTLKENTLGGYFKNFILDSLNTDLVYSKEDTIEIIRDAIGYIPDKT